MEIMLLSTLIDIIFFSKFDRIVEQEISKDYVLLQ